MIPDHYQALGVHPTADHATVRAAYRRLMRDVHPDVKPGDAAAGEAARRANAAWAVLSDSARRASYDRLRAPGRDNVITPHPPQPRPGQTLARRAYSPEGAEFRAAFHRACLRLGATVVALGTILLFALR
jgi:curved DNA-binding protein CbpA